MSDITDLFDGMSSILEQSNNTTMSFDAPMQETIDPSDLVSDGKAFADNVFNQTSRTFKKEMAMSEAYDTSQAYARIMNLYNRTRADYYNQAVEDNKIRMQRYAWKSKLLDGMCS